MKAQQNEIRTQQKIIRAQQNEIMSNNQELHYQREYNKKPEERLKKLVARFD